MIPAFLSFDVEPDAFQLDRPPPPLHGYDAIYQFAEQLREQLIRITGHRPNFGWYYRTDPQIADVYGRSDYLLSAFPERMARLKSYGDYFGVHPHPLRWCDRRGVWVHDFADKTWLVHCVQSSLKSFSEWSSGPAERARFGAGLLTNELVSAMHEAGVKVDLTLEPVRRGQATKVHTTVDTSPIDGVYTDCSTSPRTPYYPAQHDFRVPDHKHGRSLLLVPLSSTTPVPPKRPLWRRLAKRIIRGPSRPAVQMLYPFANWPSEKFFWDVVQRELQSMRRPYLSLAVRTDVDGQEVPVRIKRLFEALPNHPLAKRLSFIDPLEGGASLCERP